MENTTVLQLDPLAKRESFLPTLEDLVALAVGKFVSKVSVDVDPAIDRPVETIHRHIALQLGGDIHDLDIMDELVEAAHRDWVDCGSPVQFSKMFADVPIWQQVTTSAGVSAVSYIQQTHAGTLLVIEWSVLSQEDYLASIEINLVEGGEGDEE